MNFLTQVNGLKFKKNGDRIIINMNYSCLKTKAIMCNVDTIILCLKNNQTFNNF